MLHNVNVLTILFVPVTVFSLYSLPSSAALTQSRCNTGSEGSVWGNTARPAWPRRHACSFPLANRSTWLWGTWNHDSWPPRRHKVQSPKFNSCGDADSTSEHTLHSCYNENQILFGKFFPTYSLTSGLSTFWQLGCQNHYLRFPPLVWGNTCRAGCHKGEQHCKSSRLKWTKHITLYNKERIGYWFIQV